MTSAVQNVRACVAVEPGMKVYYDCPRSVWEYAPNHDFYERYRGKIGIVQGFPTEYVAPLDSRGRLPGVYVRPGYINVKFESENVVQKGLDVNHFIFLDVMKPCRPLLDLDFQKVRDLPHRIEFYPDDLVRVKNHLKPTSIEDIEINHDGELTYVTRSPISKRSAFTQRNQSKEIKLIERGNVYRLYENPEKLLFQSRDQEIVFWARSGVSERITRGNAIPRWEWNYQDARQMIHDGVGDIIVAVQRDRTFDLLPKHGDYVVLRLHNCFNAHRSRVRKLSLKIGQPPLLDRAISLSAADPHAEAD